MCFLRIYLLLVIIKNWSQSVNGDISIDQILAENNDNKENVDERAFTLMEHDMIVDKSDRTASRPERYRAIIDKDETKRWQRNIPFEIGDGIDDLQELTIRRAIPMWEKYSCLNFYNDKQVYNRLVFKRDYDNNCASEVGMKQGPQIVYLGKNCFKPEIVVHEIGHALGFYHEHNRWDRDNYIKIHYENIEPGQNKSFVQEKPENADFDHDYDYLSIMHYGQYFFSKNETKKLITIETTDPKFQSKIGKVKHPSFQDYKTLNAMYKCADICTKVECPKDGFLGKHCQCYCKGNPDDTPVKPCFEKEECPKPSINKYLFDVWNKENTSTINMTRTSFPDKTVLNLLSTNWNCPLASQLRCEGNTWITTISECPTVLDIERTDGNEGVVEVILNEVYRGYICDDDWDDNDATIACKMLGYTIGLAYFPRAKEVNESLPILLDNVQCSGEELSLADCKHNGWGNHDCDYSEVVSVKCFDDSFTNHINLTTNIACGKIKLHHSKRKKRHVRVIGGVETEKGMHPWQVNIQRKKRGRMRHWCGGTIINKEWILSAAHCFDDYVRTYDGLSRKFNIQDIRVIVGDHDLTKHDEYEKMFEVEYIVKHWNYSDFQRSYTNNDIALLKIKSTSGIVFNDFIQPVCLPDDLTLLLSETKCEVSGWGKENFLGHVCQSNYNKYSIDFEKVICAGDTTADACLGDSGGPLICNINGLSTVIGINSWGEGCSQKDSPGVYTKVSAYIKWINEQISNHRVEANLCPTLPQIQHGSIFQDTSDGLANNYESVAVYTCDRHFYLNGNTQLRTVKRTCQSDGTWSGKEPICEVPKCNLIEDFYGGNVKYFWGRNIYSKAFYSCDENYSMIPSNVQHSTCENNLRWEPPPPKCYKQADIYIPNDGFLRGKTRGKVWHDESYKICCHRGFEVKRDGIVPVNKELCTNIRNNNGTLEPNVECVEEWCEPDMRHTKYKHEDGSQFTSRIPRNEDVWISCEKGYAFYNSRNQLLLSPQKRRCVQGQIKGAPTCIEAKSSLAGYPYNQFTLFRDSKRNRLDMETFIEPNERIEIYCRDGYELYVESNREYLVEFITTSRYGVFDKEKNKFPVCLETKCSLVEYPSNPETYYYNHNLKVHIDAKVDYIDSTHEIGVYCNDPKQYELYVNDLNDYIDKFKTRCKQGQFQKERNKFPVCVERRCVFEPSKEQGACFVTDDERNCKREEFKIHSGSSAKIKCLKGYTFFVLGKEVRGQQEIACDKGTYPEYRCTASSCRLPEIENMAKFNSPRSHYAIGETVRDFTCSHGHILSSNKGMTCLNNGTWSDVITCVKGLTYLISAKTGTRPGAGTDANVYISLIGSGGSTRRIDFKGGFESGDVDEIRVFAKDIRPIHQIKIGHDGRSWHGMLSYWDLEYISIYVENMEEFYVFRNNRKQWVEKDNDLTLNREGGVRIMFDRGGKMSLRVCKQSCVTWKDESTQKQCVSVYYDHRHRECYGFSFVEGIYPENDKFMYSDGIIYLRTCKHNDTF